MAEFARHVPARRLVRADPGRGHPQPVGRDRSTRRASQSFQRTLAKGRKKTSAKAVSRYTTRGPTAISRSSAIPPSWSPSASSRGWTRPTSARLWRGSSTEYRNVPAGRPQGPHRRLPGRRRCAQGRGRRAPSGPGAGSPCSWARTTPRTTSSCSSRRPMPRCSNRWATPSQYDNHGQRVVEGQRLMQASSDMLLGWTRVPGVDGVLARLLRPPDVGLEDLAGPRDDGRPGHGASTRGCAAGRWPGPMPAAATGTRSPPTSGRGGRSRGHAGVRRLVRRPEPE